MSTYITHITANEMVLVDRHGPGKLHAQLDGETVRIRLNTGKRVKYYEGDAAFFDGNYTIYGSCNSFVRDAVNRDIITIYEPISF